MDFKDLLQILTYFGTNEAILWFGLVYMARDTGYRAEYHIWKEDGKFFIKGVLPRTTTEEITDLSFNGILTEWKRLEDSIGSGEIPNRDYKVVFADDGRIVPHRIKRGYKYETDKSCIYCSWKDKCWSLPDAKDEAVKIGEVKVTPRGVVAP